MSVHTLSRSTAKMQVIFAVTPGLGHHAELVPKPALLALERPQCRGGLSGRRTQRMA